MTTETFIQTLNQLAQEDFVQKAGFLVENSPWMLRSVAAARPFRDVDALCEEIERTLHNLPQDEKIALMNAHPELAGAEAEAGTMNEDSTSEQARLGLLALDHETLGQLTKMNKDYQEKFGFPCIIALWAKANTDAVMQSMAARLKNDIHTELHQNLTEIGLVVRSRAERIGSVTLPKL